MECLFNEIKANDFDILLSYTQKIFFEQLKYFERNTMLYPEDFEFENEIETKIIAQEKLDIKTLIKIYELTEVENPKYIYTYFIRLLLYVDFL